MGLVMNAEHEGAPTTVGESREFVGNLVPLGIRDTVSREEELLELHTSVFTEADVPDEVSVSHQLLSAAGMIRRYRA